MSSMTKLVVLTLIVAFAGVNTDLALAQGGLNPDEIRGETPETKKAVTVLHSRFFKKKYRPEIGVMTGFSTDEAYIDTSSLGVRFSFFFSEWLGVEAQYIKMSYDESDDYNQLQEFSKRAFQKTDPNAGNQNVDVEPFNIVPEINPIKQIIDLNVTFAPFYGKLSLGDFFTVYSDVYFTLGYAKVDTTPQGVGDESYHAVTVGLGDRLYFTESISARVDFRTRMYTEQRQGEDFFKKAYYIDFGLSYFF